jgi:hypothetical protein
MEQGAEGIRALGLVASVVLSRPLGQGIKIDLTRGRADLQGGSHLLGLNAPG